MAAPIELATTDYVNYGQAPELELIQGGVDYTHSRKLFDNYFDLRDQAMSVEKVEGDELRNVQESARVWAQAQGLFDLPADQNSRVEYYTGFSESMAREKILGLTDFLEQNFGDKIAKVELEATRAFVESAFAMYQYDEGEVAPDADGSYAFVVPARMGRNHPDYGEEVEPTIPAFRYLPNEVRAQMMVGLPPFVIDTYQYNEDGKRGYLILAPVFEDMAVDIGSIGDFQRAANHNVNAAVDFAHGRLGVDIAGLGATLPSPWVTKFGERVTNPNVITTTGHGGTIDLIHKSVDAYLEGEEPKSVGVLGLGAIGNPIAQVISERYPNAKVNVFDMKAARIRKLVELSDRFTGVEGVAALIDESEVVISAITERVSVKDLDVSVEGKTFWDDSQPGAFDPKEIEALGGGVAWIIGHDDDGKTMRRRGYDYATMEDPNTDGFGCELEAATLARKQRELLSDGLSYEEAREIIGGLAISGPVTLEGVNGIGALFDEYGIKPSRPQAFGEPVTLPKK